MNMQPAKNTSEDCVDISIGEDEPAGAATKLSKIESSMVILQKR